MICWHAGPASRDLLNRAAAGSRTSGTRAKTYVRVGYEGDDKGRAAWQGEDDVRRWRPAAGERQDVCRPAVRLTSVAGCLRDSRYSSGPNQGSSGSCGLIAVTRIDVDKHSVTDPRLVLRHTLFAEGGRQEMLVARLDVGGR